MNKEGFAWKKAEGGPLSRRNLMRGAASAVVGAGLLRPRPTFADDVNDHAACALANPIPGFVTPFKPFGVVVHHNPLSLANRMAVAGISDPSQITDFDGFVGLTHIRGGGTGTNTAGLIAHTPPGGRAATNSLYNHRS